MTAVTRHDAGGIVTLTLGRGKVNALNPGVIDELRQHLEQVERDADARAVVLTGQGAFFSFGFDVPEIISMSREEFTGFAASFTDFYTRLFACPKPVVAALNGHAIAGGCMLALACDHRVMAEGRARIGLNEIAFGASLFAGSVAMLRFLVGDARATAIAYSGSMYSGEEARHAGLVDELAPWEELEGAARRVASTLAARNAAAFAGIKGLLRRPVVEEMRQREAESIRAFVDIWYSDAVRANLAKIEIHDK